jgi:hypothetical protein
MLRIRRLLIFATLTGLACASRTARGPVPLSTVASVPWTPGLRRPVDTWEDIHAFLVFDNRVDYRPSGEFVHHRYDFVWGAGRVVEPRQGPSRDALLGYYIPANRAPRGYNLAFDDRGHTLAWYQANHPDWIVYRCPNGVEPTDASTATPAYYMDENGEHLAPLDISNPEVSVWQVEHFGENAGHVLARDGYDVLNVDNVFLDNIEGLCGTFAGGRFVRLYRADGTHDPRWCADVRDWTARLARGLHALTPPIGLVANVAPFDGIDPACLRGVTTNLDGVVDEGAFMRSDLRTPLDEPEWLARIHLMVDLQREGRAYYSIAEFTDPPPSANFCAPAVTTNELQWALASYLMGKEHSAAIFVSGLGQYGCSLWYPEFDAHVGHPCGPMRTQGTALYARDYSHGLALANLGSMPVMAALPASTALLDLLGKQVGSSLQLAARSGSVLMTPEHAPSRCP